MRVKIIPGGVPEPMWALNKVKIIENHEPLVKLEPTKSCNLLQTRDMLPYLRKTVAEMLYQAADNVPNGYTFQVISALRSFKWQTKIWQEHYERNKALHPDWPDNLIRKAANQYVAPVDQPAPPGHTTGAAVDIVLQKADGSFVDLVPPHITDWSLSHTWSKKVSSEVHDLRMMMLKVMSDVGFSNCRDEYWHYSYGDSGWAVRVGKKQCCYGVIEPPTT